MISKRVFRAIVTLAAMSAVLSSFGITQTAAAPAASSQSSLASEQANKPPYRVGGGVTRPRVLKRVEPQYSDEARRNKWQGVVVLEVVIDEKGKVVEARVVKSLGMGLDEQALKAAKKWKFAPGTKDGKPVPILVDLQVDFRLL
jgi:TonB family protein